MTALAAALYVCGHARDLADARLLLDALGLVKDGQLVEPRVPVLDINNIKNVSAIGARTWKGYAS